MNDTNTPSVDAQDTSRILYGWGQSDHVNADLKIISSDNYGLWFPSSLLMQYSSVFRSMVLACEPTSKVVRLTDCDFEKACELEHVLWIIVCIDDGDPSTSATFRKSSYYHEAFLFAQKYEIKSVMAAIKLHLYYLAAQYPPAGGELFMTAAFIGEWSLCGRLIGALNNRIVLNDREYEMYRTRLDWRYWTIRDMGRLGEVSSKFVWAICQSGAKQTAGSNTKEIDYEELGEDVASLMRMSDNCAEEEVMNWS